MQRSGARRPFGLLFPSMRNATSSPEGAAPAHVSTQKQPYAVRLQDAEPQAAKRQCVASRKTTKGKPPAPKPNTTPLKDPQSLTAKVIDFHFSAHLTGKSGTARIPCVLLWDSA